MPEQDTGQQVTFQDPDDQFAFDDLANTISDMADWHIDQVRAALYDVARMERDAVVAYIKEQRKALPGPYVDRPTEKARTSLFEIEVGIETGCHHAGE